MEIAPASSASRLRERCSSPCSATGAGRRKRTRFMSFATLVRGRAAHGPRHRRRPDDRAQRAGLRRSVQRVPGRAHRVRRVHHRALLAALHAHRGAPQARQQRAAAALPQHVPAVQLHHAAHAAFEQRRHPVGGDGRRDALHGAAGVPLPHAGEPGSGLEVLHPVLGRHRAGAVRHDPALLRRREGARTGRQRAPVDAPARGARRARAHGAVARVRVPAGRLRHQGGAGAAAQLAARTRTPRARRRSRRCSRGCCSTSRSTPWCAARCWSTARSSATSPAA